MLMDQEVGGPRKLGPGGGSIARLAVEGLRHEGCEPFLDDQAELYVSKMRPWMVVSDVQSRSYFADLD